MEKALKQTCSETLASFIRNLNYEDLPSDVIEKARYALIDTMGAIIFGSTTIEASIVRESLKDFSGNGNAIVWGTKEKTTVPLSALANGTAAHARELDDFGKNSGHPGAVIVPAALSAALEHGANGKDLLTAIVIGYEIAERATESVGGYRFHTKQGWHSTGTCCTLGAAGAVAYLLGLNEEEIASAIGIAGSYTGGLWAFIEDGAMTKRFHPGKAAENAIIAAYLARKGFKGPKYIFEAEWGGFCSTYTGGADEKIDLSVLTKGLGEDFRIMTTGFKPHACCRGIHASLDAFLQLLETNNLSKEDLQHIEIITSTHAAMQLGKKEVDSFLDAQMSLPYSIAIALLSRETNVYQYTEKRRKDQEVLNWCNRVHVYGKEDIPFGSSATVRLVLKDGTVFEGKELFPKGCPENPMTSFELQKKFRELSSTALPVQQVETLLSTLLSVDKLESLLQLTNLLRAEEQEVE
ncbi:MmgE/PrpD family protein [Bacillus sp. Marseille-P3661]|uniref:MmgE/PrpD family protein n=1 Tax=Bacillus sp. Marseille-P3661 TaxID=1936234 RepID=UPI0015E16334|nr:MmgE/PrpD family protein [Bacillus sp. Marseille-P3661]